MDWLNVLLFLNVVLFGYSAFMSQTHLIMSVALFMLYLTVHLLIRKRANSLQKSKRKTSTDETAIQLLENFLVVWGFLFVGYFGWQIFDIANAIQAQNELNALKVNAFAPQWQRNYF